MKPSCTLFARYTALLYNGLVEHFLALLDDQACFKVGLGEGLVDVGDLFLRHGEAPLLDKPAALALGAGQAGFHQQIQHGDLAVGKVLLRQLGGGHVGGVRPGAEQSVGALLGLLASSSPWTILVSS